MPWPIITDFSQAVQTPRLCFRGTEFEAGEALVNPRGMPLVYSGAFASVYCVSVGGHKFAVRCFTREVRDQQRRYNELSDYLIGALPFSFVHFEYVVNGINVRGNWYPIVRMEWVEGDSLSSFVESHLHDPDTLMRVAAQWRGGPAASLRGLRIAHNDLQHGNIMVQADGRLRLVDYDGMFLPQFRGERSPELGHKHYQHPLRSADDYDANVDNFPALVIYVSLIAIASDPGLWSFHNEDNLIFSRSDYADPPASELFGRLRQSPDPYVANLSERLKECCALPVGDVPDLEALLQALPAGVGPSPVAASPRPTRAPPAATSPPPAPPTAPRARPGRVPAAASPAPAPPTAPAVRPGRPSPAAAGAAGRPLAVPRPRAGASGPPASLSDVLDGVGQVAAGATVIVFIVTAAVAAVIAWAVSVRGW